MLTAVYHQRAIVGAAVTLAYTHHDEHGEPATAAATPTVAVARRSDGTAVTAAAVIDAGSGLYTAIVAAAANDRLDDLVATWAADGVDHERVAKIVSAPYFSLAEAGAAGYELATALTDERKRQARAVAEQEVETITGRTFVPSFRQWTTKPPGGPELITPDRSIRRLVSVVEYDTDGTTISNTWTAADLAAVRLTAYGSIRRLAATWSTRLTVISYEHGLDAPPADLTEMVMRRWRFHGSKVASAIPDRAISFSVGDGGTFRLSTPSARRTGDPDVDAIYERYTVSEFAR